MSPLALPSPSSVPFHFEPAPYRVIARQGVIATIQTPAPRPAKRKRRPARATQADIRRAVSAAKQAGATMAVEVLPDGTIRLIPTVPVPETAPKATPEPIPARRIRL